MTCPKRADASDSDFKRFIVHIGTLAAAFMAIGLVTRLPAIALANWYGMHAVFSAPLFSALIAGYLSRGGREPMLFGALVCDAIILLCMSLAMGLSWIATILASGIIAICLRRSPRTRRAWVVGFAFGSFFYPVTLVVGMVMGSYAVDLVSNATVILIACIACSLSLLGSTAACKSSQ